MQVKKYSGKLCSAPKLFLSPTSVEQLKVYWHKKKIRLPGEDTAMKSNVWPKM